MIMDFMMLIYILETKWWEKGLPASTIPSKREVKSEQSQPGKDFDKNGKRTILSNRNLGRSGGNQSKRTVGGKKSRGTQQPWHFFFR